MRKLKSFISLTVGFVGCMLAGVFALQTPKAKPTTVDAATSYTEITQVSFTGGGQESFYLRFGSSTTTTLPFASAGGICNLHGVEVWYAYSQAMYDFASQITITRGAETYNLNDKCILTVEKSGNFNIGCWGNIGGFTFQAGDVITIPQGATYELDENGDGTADYAYKFANGFRIVKDASACSAALGCNGVNSTASILYCKSGEFHAYTIADAPQTSITSIGIAAFNQEDTQIYLQMNNLSLVGTNARESDRTSEAIANWAKQMYFATSTDGQTYTYYNYYDYVKDVVGGEFAIQVQDSVNIKFCGFSNEYDTLIMPQGTSLVWDTNNDGAVDYNWVMSQTYTFVRWKGTNLEQGTAFVNDGKGTYKFNCNEFQTQTGLTCCTTADGATALDGKCNGWFHQFRTVASNVNVTSLTATASSTANKLQFALNGVAAEKVAGANCSYSIDASAWKLNGNALLDTCDVTMENGYVTVTKKSGEAFTENDIITLANGSKIVNNITGTTYTVTQYSWTATKMNTADADQTFTKAFSLIYKNGMWSAVAYFEITGVWRNQYNSAGGTYVWFHDKDGNQVHTGYNASWYDLNADNPMNSSVMSEGFTFLKMQACNQTSGLYVAASDNAVGAGDSVVFDEGAEYYIPQGTANTVIPVYWYFPQRIILTLGANSGEFTYAENLPSAPVMTGNNVFVGYKLISKADGSVVQKLYQAGAIFDPTAYTYEAVTLEMYMEKGASLRLSEEADQSGIRWTVNVNKAQLQAIKDTFGATINLGVRVRVVNTEGKVSTTESAKVCVTDILGTPTGNYYESGEYIVYNMAYVMNDSFVNVEILNGYSWLGDGFVEIVNGDATTVKAYAVQNDNARSYRGMIDYFLNHSCTTTATETNAFQITRTLADGTTEIRFYSFWNVAYQVLVSEATRTSVELKATDDSTYQNGL